MKDSTVNYEFRFLTHILRIYAHIRSLSVFEHVIMNTNIVSITRFAILTGGKESSWVLIEKCILCLPLWRLVRYRNDLSVARMKKFIVRRLTINRSIKASLIKDQFVLWDHGAILVRKINETLLVILAQRSVEEVFS